MATKRITTRVLAGLTLVSGLGGGKLLAQPTPQSLLAREPAQKGVTVSTPAGPDLAACKAEEMKWPGTGNKATGVEVRDAQGRLVRRFVDTTGKGTPNIVSFYLNGAEAYREIDANGDGKPDQFRWLGANGGKWGEDKTGDGVIDVWHVISPEEVTQELFLVIQTKDGARLSALLPREEELKAVGLPAAEIAKIMQRASGAGKKVQETMQALGPVEKAKWVHVEMGVPQTTPGDAVGSQADVVTHKGVAVLFEKGDGKSAEVFQVGDLVQVGRAWRLVDGPNTGTNATDGAENFTPEVQKLIEKLQAVATPSDPSDRAALATYHKARAAVLEEIVGKVQGPNQETFLKQTVEALATAAETGDAPAMTRLTQLRDWATKSAPGSSVAGFIAFRVVAAEYTTKLGAKDPDVGKVQTWWRESLEAFLKAYPTAEDAPEAMLRLAMAYEFTGKDGDGSAKTWYENLAKNFPNHPHKPRAEGAIRRLTSEGQPFQLTGAKLDGSGVFNGASVAGKAMVVYYWASWGRDAAAELKMLGELAKTYGPKGLEVVTVSLDTEAAKAQAALAAVPVTGHHLFAPGGLDGSPLATAYGIQMVPHVFLVGKDGKVVNKNAQSGPVLKDEVEKLMK